MRKGLGLSEQAIHRIGRALHAQDYAVDPASGDFVMPEGPSGVPTADTEGRLKALEDGLGNLQVQMQELQVLGTGIADLQNQVQQLQQPGAGGQPAAPRPRKPRQPKQPQQAPQQPQQPQPQNDPSWWDKFRENWFTKDPSGPMNDPSTGGNAQYVGSKRHR